MKAGGGDVRLTLVIASLAAGGAERVMATMANHWAERGRDVTLITLASVAADFQELHGTGIRRVALDVLSPSRNAFDGLRNNWRRLGSLSEAIRASAPDVVISFLADVNVLTLAATRRGKVPVIVAERTNPMAHRIGPFWAGMRRMLYRRASAVVVQSPEVHEWATCFVPPERVHTIPNAVMSRDGEDTAECSCTTRVSSCVAAGRHHVVAMGRLSPEKGFDLLLRAFAACRERAPQWSLVILGEGPERGSLETLADQLGIRSAVAMPGYVRNADAVLRRADMFVLPSRYEGFPNALLEAMACGLPVIATDCPSGPRHIIRNAVNGLLIMPDDVDQLSDRLLHLMNAPDERLRLGQRAVEVTERFSLERVMKCWDDLLVTALASADPNQTS